MNIFIFIFFLTQDVFITLLSMGSSGYKKLLKDREELLEYCTISLTKFAEKHGEDILNTSDNRISFGITRDTFKNNYKNLIPIPFGAMIFTKLISGTRVFDSIPPKKNNRVMIKKKK